MQHKQHAFSVSSACRVDRALGSSGMGVERCMGEWEKGVLPAQCASSSAGSWHVLAS